MTINQASKSTLSPEVLETIQPEETIFTTGRFVSGALEINSEREEKYETALLIREYEKLSSDLAKCRELYWNCYYSFQGIFQKKHPELEEKVLMKLFLKAKELELENKNSELSKASTAFTSASQPWSAFRKKYPSLI